MAIVAALIADVVVVLIATKYVCFLVDAATHRNIIIIC